MFDHFGKLCIKELTAYNRATCLNQTQGIMKEERVTKRLICVCNLSHV